MLTLTDTNFETKINETDLPVLVDFFADWCEPCRQAMPVIEELANQYAGRLEVARVNVEQSMGLAQKYTVMSIPTVIIFKKGQEVRREVGFPGKEGYLRLIQGVLKEE